MRDKLLDAGCVFVLLYLVILGSLIAGGTWIMATIWKMVMEW